MFHINFGAFLSLPRCRPCAADEANITVPMDQESDSLWLDLPLELVEKIFSHLDLASMAAASQVCRHFHRARWEHMDLSAHPDVPMSAFSKLMQRLPMRLTVPRLTAMPALPTLVLELFQGTVLNLRNCRLPPGGLDVLLAQHKSELRELCLANCNINAGNIRVVEQLLMASLNLQVLDLSDNNLDADSLLHLADHLPQLPALRRLTLADNPLNPSAARALLTLLRKCPALEELHLDTTGLGDQGCAILAEQAEPVLHLRWLSLGDNGLTRAGIVSLAQAIEVRREPHSKAAARPDTELHVQKWRAPLQKLDLHANTLGNEGAAALATALETNTTLQALVLWDNRIGDRGAQALADVLFRNTTVTSLDLKFNGVGSAGAIAFSAALKCNTTLRALKLRFNLLENDGAQALASCLRVNQGLRCLDLEENGITNAGAAALGEALQYNQGLEDLKLKNNTIGDVGCRGLALGLVRNRSLKKLDLTATRHASDRMPMTSRGLRELAQALQHNTRLKELVLTGLAGRVTQPLTRLFARSPSCKVVFTRAKNCKRLRRVRRRSIFTFWRRD